MFLNYEQKLSQLLSKIIVYSIQLNSRVELSSIYRRYVMHQKLDHWCVRMFYQIISDESIKPASKLVLLLDDVVRNGSTTSVLWLGPTEGDRLVVEVHDARLARSAGRFWKWLVIP